jgi:hypothetical protein
MPPVTLPPIITKFLWDADLKLIDVQKNAPAIIERILEYGDLEALKALTKIYSEEQIITALKSSRRLSAKPATFFSLYYQVDPQEVRGLRQPFLQKQNRFS